MEWLSSARRISEGVAGPQVSLRHSQGSSGVGSARDLLFRSSLVLGLVAWTVAPNQEGSNQNFASIKTAISKDNRSQLNLAGTP
jgi:hypothetical protein